jgi:antitoxin MazE
MPRNGLPSGAIGGKYSHLKNTSGCVNRGVGPRLTRQGQSIHVYSLYILRPVTKNEVIHMRKKVNKWGNSLGLRIPKLVATEVGLEENSLVNLTIVNGSIVISPERETPLELEAMLKQVTEENLHGEVNTGPAIGREAW